jgi:hypothetical protein
MKLGMKQGLKRVTKNQDDFLLDLTSISEVCPRLLHLARQMVARP